MFDWQGGVLTGILILVLSVTMGATAQELGRRMFLEFSHHPLAHSALSLN